MSSSRFAGGIAFRLLIFMLLAAVLPAQEALLPKRTAEGIEFAVRAPATEKVWLLGDFNQWGEPRTDGTPAPSAAMTLKPGDGTFHRTEKLKPGTYRFRYVLEGRLADPIALDAALLPLTPEGNHILRIDPEGNLVAVGTPYVYTPTPVEGGVEFRVYAPTAKSVFVVGTFNNWGDAQGRLVTDVGYRCFRVANKEFVKVMDLPAGRHEFAAVLDLGQGANTWIDGPAELPLSDSKHRSFVVAPKAGATPVPTPTPAPEGRVPPAPFAFPPHLLPDGGVEFAVYSPTTKVAHVYGDFNGWGTHEGPEVKFPCTQLYDVGKGYFRRTIYLPPDTYAFKYCLDGRTPWIAPSSVYLKTDTDGNGLFTIANGTIALTGKYDPWKIYTFAQAPAERKPVQSARMVRIFYQPGTPNTQQMLKWVYGPAGRELNRRIPIYLMDSTKASPTRRIYQVLRVPTAVLAENDGAERERVVFDGNIEAFLQKLEAMARKGMRQ